MTLPNAAGQSQPGVVWQRESIKASSGGDTEVEVILHREGDKANPS